MSGLTWNGSSSPKELHSYHPSNPVSSWEPALPKSTEVQDDFQGGVAWSCLFFVDISASSPPVETHRTFLIFQGFEWGFGSALGLRAPGAILPTKNEDQSQI